MEEEDMPLTSIEEIKATWVNSMNRWKEKTAKFGIHDKLDETFDKIIDIGFCAMHEEEPNNAKRIFDDINNLDIDVNVKTECARMSRLVCIVLSMNIHRREINKINANERETRHRTHEGVIARIVHLTKLKGLHEDLDQV